MKQIITSLLIAFIISIGTAYGQSTTRDSVYYTDKQDKRAIECFEINKDLNILIDQQIQMLEANFYKNEELQEDNSKLEVKIKKKNKTIINWITATALAVVVVIVK